MAAPLRLHVALPMVPGQPCELPAEAVRHLQVRRLQPGDAFAVFDGRGGEWDAEVLQIGRQSVRVRIGEARPVLPEPVAPIGLAVGVPANERMDTVVEKATELGAARLQPLLTERAVLRLSGERAERRRAHWQAIAVAASEQCGRATVPAIAPLMTLQDWLGSLPPAGGGPAAPGPASGTGLPRRLLLSPRPGHPGLAARTLPSAGAWVLSGPEGGLSAAEEAAAEAAGFEPTGLGPRVLRADTAPLAAMAWFALQAVV